MSENCPYCGTKLFWSQGQTTEFECRTMITETGLDPSRGKECLIKQLAQQGELLRKTLEILRTVASHEGMAYYDVTNITKKKAQDIIPDLEDILEKVK